MNEFWISAHLHFFIHLSVTQLKNQLQITQPKYYREIKTSSGVIDDKSLKQILILQPLIAEFKFVKFAYFFVSVDFPFSVSFACEELRNQISNNEYATSS